MTRMNAPLIFESAPEIGDDLVLGHVELGRRTVRVHETTAVLGALVKVARRSPRRRRRARCRAATG